MTTQFERTVLFTPAFDKRDPSPNKNYGIHGVELRMYLKGPLGVVQFILFTNWQLPHVTEEILSKGQGDRLSLRCNWVPMAADLGYHWREPQYEGQDIRKCDLLEGAKCFYDGSGVNAERIYEVLLREGSDGVWRELEAEYAALAKVRL